MSPSLQGIVYVTRDIERALGMLPHDSYLIVSNRASYSEMIQSRYGRPITLIDSANDPRITATESLRVHDVLSTAQILDSDKTAAVISSHTPPLAVVVFKNTTQIESIAQKRGWHLLNPSAVLAEKIENKMSQVEWLGPLAKKYLPSFDIITVSALTWKKEPLIIQWEHGHSGDGTIIVNSQEELSALQAKFPNRIARATYFINGPTFTLNIIVSQDGVHTGNISYQITGIPPFTENVFTTIGNDWSLPHSLLTDTEISYIHDMAHEIGLQMKDSGWKGLFGIDVIKDNERDVIRLIEINARQPASTTTESLFQLENRRKGIAGITVFEAHLLALSDRPVAQEIIPINDGAQLVQRLTRAVKGIPGGAIGSLELTGHQVIPYENTGTNNSDLLRIRSERGVMESHGKFNARGKEIVDILTGGSLTM